MSYLVFICALLFSCGGNPASGIDVRIEPGLEEVFAKLVSGKDAPAFLAARSAAPVPESAAKIRLELGRRSWKDVASSPAGGLPPIGRVLPEVGAVRIVDRRFFVPTVPFLDPRRGVGLAELSGAVQGGRPTLPVAPVVKPLEAVRPPEKALTVDGMRPGDAGYPLVEETVLRLSASADADGGGGRLEEIRAWLEALPEPEAPRFVFLAAVGDVMAGRGVDAVLLGGAEGVERVFGDTLPLLRGADLALGNIEGAITRRTVKTPKAYNFRFPPEILRPLRAAGFGYLAPTNNHIYDYGEGGLIDTLEALRAEGMGFSGVGRTWKEAASPWEGNVAGMPIRVVSVGAYPREAGGFDGRKQAAALAERPGILWADDAALRAMRESFSPDTYDIVMAHGGEEWRNEPSSAQRALYRSFIDAGADLVLGSHPHVLQGIEAYGAGLIAYSLGNFIFPGMDETRYGEESLILSVGIYRGVPRYLDFYPAKLGGRGVRRDERSGILERFIGLSERLGR